jgi:hypothetical protein
MRQAASLFAPALKALGHTRVKLWRVEIVFLEAREPTEQELLCLRRPDEVTLSDGVPKSPKTEADNEPNTEAYWVHFSLPSSKRFIATLYD